MTRIHTHDSNKLCMLIELFRKTNKQIERTIALEENAATWLLVCQTNSVTE